MEGLKRDQVNSKSLHLTKGLMKALLQNLVCLDEAITQLESMTLLHDYANIQDTEKIEQALQLLKTVRQHSNSDYRSHLYGLLENKSASV